MLPIKKGKSIPLLLLLVLLLLFQFSDSIGLTETLVSALAEASLRVAPKPFVQNFASGVLDILAQTKNQHPKENKPTHRREYKTKISFCG